ncbi:MAG: glutamate-cysteine ligase family protein [Candidatus Thermoplasmatota archaeon]
MRTTETYLSKKIIHRFTALVIFLLLSFTPRRGGAERGGKELPPPPPPDESKVVNIKEWSGKGKCYSRIIEELQEEFPEADHIGLERVKMVEDRLVGVFFIESENRTLRYRDIEYKFVLRAEINSSEEVNHLEEELSGLSSGQKEIDAHEVNFFVDEYEQIYLKINGSYKKISSTRAERGFLLAEARSWISANCSAARNELKIKNTVQEEDTFTFLFADENEVRDHQIVLDEKGSVLNYRKLDELPRQMSGVDRSDLTELPYTHGIEIELQVVKENWEWVEADQMAIVFKEILNRSRKKITNLRDGASSEIQNKWRSTVEIKEDDKGYEAVHVDYSVGDESSSYSVLGKDSHVTFKTNILEIQTPPCEYLEELEWWIYNLYRIAHEVVRGLNIDADLIPVGTNPVEDYSEGLSFGEHHHLGVEDEELRKEIYNTFRYLIPHLIAISSNSPFLDGKCPESTLNDLGNLVITDPSYTMRLEKNVEQFRVPPHLPSSEEAGRKYLERELERKDESLRMIDIYPFTRFDTIEVRIFDTQVTTTDRISIALLLQAIALSVRERLEEEDEPRSPPVSYETLKKNREQSIKDGLLGRIYIGKRGLKSDKASEKNIPKYLYEDWQRILRELYPYFEKMDVERTAHLKNILLRVFGLKDQPIGIEPPISPSQLLVYRYSEEGESDLEPLLKELRRTSLKVAEDMRYDLWSKYTDLDEIELSDFEAFP